MKRTIIFLILFSGLLFISATIPQKELGKTDVGEFKIRVNRTPCDGYTATVVNSGWGPNTCGPTHSGCACSVLGVPAGYYTVSVYDGCHFASKSNVYHSGYGQIIVDLYPSDACQ